MGARCRQGALPLINQLALDDKIGLDQCPLIGIDDQLNHVCRSELFDRWIECVGQIFQTWVMTNNHERLNPIVRFVD